MNYWIMAAGIIAAGTSLVHIFAGQVDPVRPFLTSSLAPVPKATLLACWHMVSVVLLCSAVSLCYIGSLSQVGLYPLSSFIGVLFLLFSLVFAVVGFCMLGKKALLQLPQWILLMPIGAMSLYGALA